MFTSQQFSLRFSDINPFASHIDLTIAKNLLYEPNTISSGALFLSHLQQFLSVLLVDKRKGDFFVYEIKRLDGLFDLAYQVEQAVQIGEIRSRGTVIVEIAPYVFTIGELSTVMSPLELQVCCYTVESTPQASKCLIAEGRLANIKRHSAFENACLKAFEVTDLTNFSK
jgi:hypothetical protein